MMKYIMLAALLSGCAHVAYPAAAQPRALAWGSSIPSCIFICIANTTITDAESGGATSTVNSTETIAPSGSIGIGGGACVMKRWHGGTPVQMQCTGEHGCSLLV